MEAGFAGIFRTVLLRSDRNSFSLSDTDLTESIWLFAGQAGSFFRCRELLYLISNVKNNLFLRKGD